MDVKSQKKKTITIRSSAAEYLTFLASGGKSDVEAIYADESIWLTQKMMAVLYDVEPHTISEHIGKIYKDSEVDEKATHRNFRIVRTEGSRQVERDILHYSLKTIIAVGYKVNSEQAVQFRKWATNIIDEFTIKAYVMDDERLKSSGSVLTEKYFEEQLERIREIRVSEKKFYQKITDIYATAIDYDRTASVTKRFFATVQNKLHWAIHGQTAAKVTAEIATAHAESEFEKYRITQDKLFKSDFDVFFDAVNVAEKT